MAGPAVVSTLLLRNVPVFSQLPEGQLSLLTKVVSRKTFPRSTTIINAGDPTDALYIVISGRLKVMMSDDEGREVILAILGQGEFFGEMALLDEGPHLLPGRLAALLRRPLEVPREGLQRLAHAPALLEHPHRKPAADVHQVHAQGPRRVEQRAALWAGSSPADRLKVDDVGQNDLL